MTIGFGFASTLLLLGFVVLVFVLLAATRKESRGKLNSLDLDAENNEMEGGNAVGAEGFGYYLDDDDDMPMHKIG